MTDVRRIRRARPERALEHEPHGPLGETLLAQRHPFAGKRLRARALGAFGNRTAIPRRRREALRQRPHRQRRLRWRGDHAFGAYLSFLGRGVLWSQGALKPTAGLGRHRHERRAPHTSIDGVKEVWAMALETIRHQIPPGQAAFVPDGLDHVGGHLGLGVKGHLLGHLTLVSSLRVGVRDCNRNGSGLQSPHFWDRIICLYPSPQDRIICL